MLDEPLGLGIVPLELEPELASLGEYVTPARQLRYEDARFVSNHRWINVLIGAAVAKHRRYVLASLVREGAVSNERLLEWQRQVGDLGDGSRDVGESAGSSCRQRVEAQLQDQVGDHGDEVGVSAALAITVDRPLHHVRSGHHSLEAVGDGELAIVVAMNADADLQPQCIDGAPDRFDALPDLGRQAAAVGVAQDHPTRPCAGGDQANFDGVLGVPRETVEEMLRVKDDLAAQLDPIRDRVAHHVQVLGGRGLQHGAHLPRVALADQRPDSSAARDQRVQVGVVLALLARPSRGPEGSEARVFERVRCECGKQLLILRV